MKDRIIIIRSLDETTKTPFYSQLKKNYPASEIFDINSAEEFKQIVTPETLCIDTKSRPDFLLDMHGSPEGLVLRDQSVLKLEDEAKLFQLINRHCFNNLILFSGACHGAMLHRLFKETEYPVYRQLIAGNGDVWNIDSQKAFLHYLELKDVINRNDAARLSIDAIPAGYYNTFKALCKNNKSDLAPDYAAQISHNILNTKTITKQI